MTKEGFSIGIMLYLEICSARDTVNERKFGDVIEAGVDVG
jgi:hypothetical protein